MNDNYKDYNIIPIGDHCAISLILGELEIRKKSYPFDWIVNVEQINESNIMYNIDIIQNMRIENVSNIVNMYIGNAFDNDKINKNNNIWFPHDDGNITEIFEKYERRFKRLYEDVTKKNIFILLTRRYYIDEKNFNKIMKTLLIHNKESIIVFISGINHMYFEDKKYERVIFKYIFYDASQAFTYDFDTFRPNIKIFLQELLL